MGNGEAAERGTNIADGEKGKNEAPDLVPEDGKINEEVEGEKGVRTDGKGREEIKCNRTKMKGLQATGKMRKGRKGKATFHDCRRRNKGANK